MKRRAVLGLVLATSGCLELESAAEATRTTTAGTRATTATTTERTTSSVETEREPTDATEEEPTETTEEGPEPRAPGNLRWAQRLRAPVETGVTRTGDRALVGAADDRVRAFDASDGSVAWTASLPSEPSGDVVVADGTGYATTFRGTVAVDASTGREQWAADAGGRPTPLVADGRLYAPDNDEVVRAIDVDDGTVEWRFEAAGGNPLTPVLVDGTLVFGGLEGFEWGDGSGRLYGLDPATGEERWRREFPEGPLGYQSSLAALDGTAFLSVQGDRVLALDPASGETTWERTHAGDSRARGLTVADGRLFVGGRVGERDPVTGEWLWRLDDGRVWRLAYDDARGQLVGFDVDGDRVLVVDPSAGDLVREYAYEPADQVRGIEPFGDTLVVADGTYVRGLWHTAGD
jgi:outer membrane protein assembly factor BamB